MTRHSLEYRAHTDEQKREVIERLYRLWVKCPSLRLGQLIINCFDMDFYYTEDFDLIETLEAIYQQLEEEHTA